MKLPSSPKRKRHSGELSHFAIPSQQYPPSPSRHRRFSHEEEQQRHSGDYAEFVLPSPSSLSRQRLSSSPRCRRRRSTARTPSKSVEMYYEAVAADGEEGGEGKSPLSFSLGSANGGGGVKRERERSAMMSPSFSLSLDDSEVSLTNAVRGRRYSYDVGVILGLSLSPSLS